MTEHFPTDAFQAQSFLDGANAGYVDQLLVRLASDPALGGKGDAESKIAAMKEAGIVVAESSAHLGQAVMQAIKG